MRRGRTELRRAKALGLGLVLGAWAVPGAFSALAAEKPLGYKVTVYEVWASDESSKEFPKELKKFQKQLEKTTKKKSFKLEKKPTPGEVREGKPMTLALPGGYQVRFTFDAKKPEALSQVLVNPKKEESELLLKKSPVITTIERVRKADGTFLILVEFEALKKA